MWLSVLTLQLQGLMYDAKRLGNFSQVCSIPKVLSKMTRDLTFEKFSRSRSLANDATRLGKFLKSQLATKCAMENS